MTEEEIRKACESAFQAGGPRVYRFETARGKLLPSGLNAKRTLELADKGDVVWSRRKIGDRYGWRAAHKV